MLCAAQVQELYDRNTNDCEPAEADGPECGSTEAAGLLPEVDQHKRQGSKT